MEWSESEQPERGDHVQGWHHPPSLGSQTDKDTTVKSPLCPSGNPLPRRCCCTSCGMRMPEWNFN